MNISLDLKREIMRLQLEAEIGEEEATSRAATIIKSNRAEIEKEIQKRVNKEINSEVLTKINGMRRSIAASAFEKGAEHVRDHELRFQVNCKNCGMPMHFSSDRKNWAETTKILDKAFENWTHVDCKGA